MPMIETLAHLLEANGPEAMLAALAEQLRIERKYHELFDVLLMHQRWKLGLPVVLTTPIDRLAEPMRSRLEDAYLKVCHEIGTQLLAEKRVREAWPYLRPLGDRDLIIDGLASIVPDEENVQPMIEILLYEGLDVGRGYQLVLDHFGTCNAISVFEGTVLSKARTDRQDAAARLVRHLHEELSANVRADIERREGKPPPGGATIGELLAPRPHLLDDNAYHVDVSHLAATLRYARLLEDPVAIASALDLAEYGMRVSPELRGSQEAPFAEARAEVLFLAAQLGRQVPEALDYFRTCAEQSDSYREGTLAAEVFVVLLARLDRLPDAIAAAAQYLAPAAHTTGFAPSLMELSQQAGDYTTLLQTCFERGDPVGYAAGLLAQSQTND